jgi:acyl-CoA thioesterase I
MKIKNIITILIFFVVLVITTLFLLNSGQLMLDREITVIAFGDSLTYGTGVDSSDSYPSQLQEKLKDDDLNVKIINKGVSGETSAGALARISEIIELRPDVVILATGANDGLQRINPEETKNNISNIIKKFNENDIEILFCGMSIVLAHGLKYSNNFKSIFKDLAKKYNLEFVPFLLKGVTLNPELNIEDGMHPNKEGYKIVVENIYHHLISVLKKF